MKPADLRWEGDQPRSERFGDVYHDADGPAETRRVFCAPIELDRLLGECGELTLVEFGFGTALNLAVLLDVWSRSARPRLHFISCEQHPLTYEDWSRTLAQRAGRTPSYTQLSHAYPPLVPGWHRRSIANGRVQLSLFWGSAAAMLDDLEAQQGTAVDCWWLDGFAPDRNPELWDDDLLTRLGPLSRRGSRVATFTAAGRVRRSLEGAGFRMWRVDQRPHKRESLAGRFEADPRSAAPTPTQLRWRAAGRRARDHGVTIIGAGMAGAQVARHLAERGFDCSVYDAGPGPLGPSALPVALAHSRLLLPDDPNANQRAAAQLYASDWLRRFGALDEPQIPTVQLAGDERALDRLHRIAVAYRDPRWLREVRKADLDQWTGPFAGTAQRELGLLFPGAGPVATGPLIERLLEHERIRVFWQSPIVLGEDPVTGGTAGHETTVDGPLRIVTVGTALRQLTSSAGLEIAPLGGQMDRLAVAKRPAAALVGTGYLVPSLQEPDQLFAGGNFEYSPWAPARATAQNLRQIPSAAAPRWLRRHRAVRLATSDRQPILGFDPRSTDPTLPTAVLLGGFGSLGMTQTPLTAAALTGLLAGEIASLGAGQLAALAPERFRARQQRRGRWRGAR